LNQGRLGAGSYGDVDCEKNCELTKKIQIVSSVQLSFTKYQPSDFVWKYLVKTRSMAKYPRLAEHIVIIRSYDIAKCAILRVERSSGVYAIPHDEMEKF
jgi:hypothetical protein